MVTRKVGRESARIMTDRAKIAVEKSDEDND